MSNIWKNGIYGLVVGDALGVPVEFTSREARKADPVVDMREFGTHNQPKGTWSDDSSMALATLASIRELGKVDCKDIMDRFAAWCLRGEYTPFGQVFDIGIATSKAISKYEHGTDALKCGGAGDWDNGNGSLMRILPVCLHMYEKQKKVCTSEDESIYTIHNVSALTHAHPRSQLACGIYYFFVKAILEEKGTLLGRLQSGIDNAHKYYRHDMKCYPEMSRYSRMNDMADFKDIPEAEIKSSGYVVASLEAAVWCLLNSQSYEDAVLKAVNLGDDTDTVGAITGSLAGLYYDFDAIPSEWVEVIQKKELIDELISF